MPPCWRSARITSIPAVPRTTCLSCAPCSAFGSAGGCAIFPIANSLLSKRHPSMATSAQSLGRRIKEDVIREHWDDILRLVASLKAGTVLPSAMLRRLAAFQRQNQLDLALQKLGRIERSLFMLGLARITATQATVPSRTEQERATSRSGAGDLHLQAGPHRRSRP